MRRYRTAYPVSWQVFDLLETVAARLWPARLAPALPYPALLQVDAYARAALDAA